MTRKPAKPPVFPRKFSPEQRVANAVVHIDALTYELAEEWKNAQGSRHRSNWVKRLTDARRSLDRVLTGEIQ